MNSLDTLPLPIAQFTSLSILLQLHHEDFSTNTNNGSGQNNTADEAHWASNTPPPTLHQCHSLSSDKPKFVPVYPENSKVYYIPSRQSQVDDIDENNIETPQIKEATVVTVHYDDLLQPFYTILVEGREKQTDNAHLSLSPDGKTNNGNVEDEADVSAGTQRSLSRSVLRHDLTALSPFCMYNREAMEGALESLHKKIIVERGMRDDFSGVGKPIESVVTKEVREPPPKLATEDDTVSSKRKGVSFHQDTKAGKEAAHTTPGSLEEGKQKSKFERDILPLKNYQPPTSHTGCSLGVNLNYVQINIEDMAEENEDTALFRRIMSVLLPDIPFTSLKPIDKKEKQSAVILLAVAFTGPSYDLYGCSSLVIDMPKRLNEGICILEGIDTAPKKEEIIIAPVEELAPKRSKSNKIIAISPFNKNEEEQSDVPKATVTYDSGYFERLYLAVLATIMDDEDGLLRDHDAIALMNNKKSTPEPAATMNRSKDVSKPKTKLFTFSRKGGNNSGDDIDGGINPLEIELDQNKSDSSSFHAEIARREAMQMELLSLAEDDMSLPQYEHAGENERKRPPQVKSPKAGGGMVTITSGRFGRKENHFDLAGFEYKPSFGAGSVSGTASTMASSDDVSTATGDETATLSSKYTMLSNASSVPTLSKSKKDSGGRSSRFKFLQKRKENKALKSPSKPPLPSQTRQIPQQDVFDPFRYDADVINEEQEDETEVNEGASVASGSTKETSDQQAQQVIGAVSRSFSEDESEARSLPTSAPPTPIALAEDEESDIVEPEPDQEPAVPLSYLDVDLALNEDLTCEYKKSKLSSITVDGTVQVRVKNQQDLPPDAETQPPTPFYLMLQDHSRHIKSVQENKKFVQHVDAQSTAREYTYSIRVPRENEYFPVVRYKCTSSLRPVPIRVQSRVRTQGTACRVALQISANPSNPSDLVHLTIIMGVPKDIVKGHSLQCNPPGGTYNEQKSVVLWCVSELGGGEKFQLQAIFELEEEYMNAHNDVEATAHLASKLEFPVLARCQCTGAQLSDVGLEVVDVPDQYPVEIRRNVVKRFRICHKEK